MSTQFNTMALTSAPQHRFTALGCDKVWEEDYDVISVPKDNYDQMEEIF